MKIGLVVHFFDFRNDVRQWIQALSALHEIVLFVRPQDAETIAGLAPEGLEVRLIDEKKPGLWNRFWEFAFRFFGKLPESRQNYFLMESFRISIINQAEKAARATRLLNISMSLPRILSYDFFISQLKINRKTNLDGIDQFICFTELSDNYLMNRLLQEGKAPLVYVYSWDHPCKHTRFSTRMKYLVWHKGIAEDMTNLQHIPKENIRILGATQLAYVDRWMSKKEEFPNPFPFDYLYFGCAIGVPQLVESELLIVRKLAAEMAQLVPDWKLVVRPYPVMKDWSPYEALRDIPNLVLDDGFRSQKVTSIAVNEDFILEKFVKIHHSKAFLHLGTTLGIEASYTDAPSVLLDIKEYNQSSQILSLQNFIHQFQNDKYINLTDYPNVVTSLAGLRTFLANLNSNPESFQPYNKRLASDIQPKSFSTLANELSTILSA